MANEWAKSVFPEVLLSLLSMFSLLFSKLDSIWSTLLNIHQLSSLGWFVIYFWEMFFWCYNFLT